MVDLAMKNNMMKNECSLLGCANALLGMQSHNHVERVERSIKNAKINHVARIYGNV